MIRDTLSIQISLIVFFSFFLVCYISVRHFKKMLALISPLVSVLLLMSVCSFKKVLGLILSFVGDLYVVVLVD